MAVSFGAVAVGNFITGTPASSYTMSRPATAPAGTLLVAFVVSESNTIWSSTGWNVIDNFFVTVQGGTATARASVLWKMAGASEPTSYTFSSGSLSGAIKGWVATYTGSNTSAATSSSPATPLRENISGTTAFGTTTGSELAASPPNKSMVPGDLVLHLALAYRNPSAGGTLTNWSSGVTARYTDPAGSRYSLNLGDEIYAAAGSELAPASAAWSAAYDNTYMRSYLIHPAQSAPNPPAITLPTPGAYLRTGATVSLRWNFTDNDTAVGETQKSFALRRKLTSASVYEYWNNTSAVWQATEVFNLSNSSNANYDSTTKVGSYDFLTGWTAGSYTFAVATKDSSDVAGPYSPDQALTVHASPTVTIQAPTAGGTVSGSTVNVTFIPTSFGGSFPKSYTVSIVPVSDTGSRVGYASGTFDALLYNGTSYTVPVSVATTQTAMQVIVSVTDSHGIDISEGATQPFTLTPSGPPAPVLVTRQMVASFSALAYTGMYDGPRGAQGKQLGTELQITSTMPVNLLDDDNARFTNTAGSIWSARGWVRTATDNTSAGAWMLTNPATTTAPVVGSFIVPITSDMWGKVFTYETLLRLVATNLVDQQFRIDLIAKNSSATILGTATRTYAQMAPSNTWVIATNAYTIPTNTATMTVTTGVQSGDSVTSFAWTMGGNWASVNSTYVGMNSSGIYGNLTYLPQVSYDYGITWKTLRNYGNVGPTPASNTAAVVLAYDFEAPINGLTYYRVAAKTNSVPSLPGVTGSFSSSVSATLSSTDDWWLKDPLDPTRNMTVDVQDSFDSNSEEQQMKTRPLGRSKAVVISGVVQAEEGSLHLYFSTEADYTYFETLRKSQRTLLMQDPFGHQWYVRLGPVRNSSLKSWDAYTAVRDVTVTWAEVDTP